MKEIIRKQPILCSVAAAFIMASLILPAQLLISPSVSEATWLLWDSAMRVILTIPSVLLLGYILQSDGFRFAFNTKGFLKGMFACAAIFLLIVEMILRIFNMSEMNLDYIPKIPAVIAQQITTGLYEETVFRGLFMTAMLVRWSATAKGRAMVVLISGFVFGAAHLVNIFNSEDVAGILRWSLNTCMMGIGFSAVYLYAKNLMSCMLIHALNNIAAHLSSLIAADSENTLRPILNVAWPILMYAAIPLFALFLCVKAKPFVLEERRRCLS